MQRLAGNTRPPAARAAADWTHTRTPNRRSSPTLIRHAAMLAICALALLGCGGGGDGISGPGDSPRTEVPDVLVDQWQNAISTAPGVSDYLAEAYDFPTNLPDLVEIQSSTLGYAWKFEKNGDYSHLWMLETVYMLFCVRELYWEERGTVVLGGSTLALHPRSAKFIALDSCDPGMTYDGPANPEAITFGFTLGRDAAGDDMLTLTYPSGSTLELYRAERWTSSGLVARPGLSPRRH
jgi:hypothetical protein